MTTRDFVVHFPSSLTAAVMALPVLKHLQDYCGNEHVFVICEEEIAQLISLDKWNNTQSTLFPHTPLPLPLHACQRSGIVLDQQSSSMWRLLRDKTSIRAGLASSFVHHYLLTHPVVKKKHEHTIMSYHRILQEIDVPFDKVKGPSIQLSDKHIQQGLELLTNYQVDPQTTLVAFMPFSSSQTKCWPKEYFQEVIQALLKQPNITAILLGEPQHLPQIKELCYSLPPQVVNLAGLTSLATLSAILYHCDLLVSGDHGGLHLADALGTFVLGVYGSTSPTQNAPYNTGTTLYKNAPCSPCNQKQCPSNLQCLTSVQPQEVYNALLFHLNCVSAKQKKMSHEMSHEYSQHVLT